MNILYTCLSESWGGMEMYSLTTSEKLINKGHKVSLLCLENSRLHKNATSKNIPTVTINNFNYFGIFSILKIYSILKGKKIEIIHSQASKDLWMLVPALNMGRIKTPLLLTKHVGSFIIKKDFFHKKLYKRTNRVYAISRVIENNLLNTCPVLPDKVQILHDGIDLTRFNKSNSNRQEIRKEFGVDDDTLFIGMMARISPGKGHEDFIAAANKLSSKYKNLKFVIIGEASHGEDNYANKILNLASGLLEKNLLLTTGYRSDIPEVLSALDIFVFPSHAEALGLALIEAMAMGIPNVCSDSDGILDVAVDSVTSILYQSKSVEGLINATSKLIEDSILRKLLSDNSVKRIEEKFNLDKIMDKTIEYYDREIKLARSEQ